MPELNDWQVLKRFVRDHGEAQEDLTLSAEEVRRLALAASNSLKTIEQAVRSVHEAMRIPPPREGTYEEHYGEPEPVR